MKRFTVISIVLLFFIPSCSWFKSEEEKPAHELASEGMDAFKRKKYRKSIESFEKLKDWYPFSKYVILAELKVADGYYHLKEYEEAVFAYEAFENLHPRNEAIPYVVYQIGRCYFDQIDSVDRDQSSTRKALENFERLTKRFPNSTYTHETDKHIKDCMKSLAGHEFHIGLFYYKTKHYRAALNRFTEILSKYPDAGLTDEALKYIDLSKAKLEESPVKN